jgi:BTB/POZ domain
LPCIVALYKFSTRADKQISLFNDAEYSDVTIFIGKSKTKLPAHSLVLCIRSPYFADALKGEFVEGKTREFTYAEDSPHALWRVFQYIYTGDYSDEASGALDCEGLLIQQPSRMV